jgi:predicted metal-binding protein
MNPDIQVILASLGVTRSGEVAVPDIVFNPAFREACAANQCGQYGTNWACPPGIGEPAELIAHAKTFARGLVIQTVWPLEDAFDFDGMMAGKDKHTALFRRVVARVAPLLAACGADATARRTRPAADRGGPTGYLALSAGTCSVCETCTFSSGEPCRLPGQAMASLEAYCIDVAALIEAAGLSYNNGPDTVSYVGLILF